MVSAVSNTTRRDRTSIKMPHRRLFVRALCRVTTRAFSNTLAMATSATASATVTNATAMETLTVAGVVFSAAFSADLELDELTANSKQQAVNSRQRLEDGV